jgi:malate synthase
MTSSSIEILGADRDRFDEILTPDALHFLARLHDLFLLRRQERLAERLGTRTATGNGRDLRFLAETRSVRDEHDWTVAGAGPGLEDRRVEITGPTDRKMTINAMNSGANVWLADHEDALSPTWENVIGGQVNLSDAIRGTIDYVSPEGKRYQLGDSSPTIVFRPRGWHLVEKHLRYRGPSGIPAPASASLVDFGLYAFHNAKELIARGSGPYFYLPKLENHLEARLWDDVFTFTENALGMTHGTIRATVLIETVTAAFEMEEILYELRDHCAGLNAGRWDYLFSIIKTFRDRGRRFVLPDRSKITMTVPFMRAYTRLLVQTCHRRGAHAIGGMSAFIPDRKDVAATEAAIERVSADKRREAGDGFDGTWVAHPGLIEVARTEFDAVLGERPNQLEHPGPVGEVSAADLLDVSFDAAVTDQGVATNVSVALRYLESWLRGIGAAAIDGLMEDAATAEISRSQLWQWIRNEVVTADGTLVTAEFVDALLTAEAAGRSQQSGEGSRFEEAAEILRYVALREEFPSFLTIPAYSWHLVETRESVAA